MKLLLTSIGLSTPKLRETFLALVQKPPEEITIAFIPTAAVSDEEKENVKKSKQQLLQLGIQEKIFMRFI